MTVTDLAQAKALAAAGHRLRFVRMATPPSPMAGGRPEPVEWTFEKADLPS